MNLIAVVMSKVIMVFRHIEGYESNETAIIHAQKSNLMPEIKSTN